MSILPQDHEFVNSRSAKWSEKKAASAFMAERLAKFSDLKGRAARMAACCDDIAVKRCTVCGHVHPIGGIACKDRLCPLCGWRLALTRYAQMMETIKALETSFDTDGIFASMLTLTARNIPVSRLGYTLQKFTNAWRQVSDRACMSQVVGWARNLEITYNVETRTYHPHFHIILIWQGVEPEASAKLAAEIKKEWDKQLGINYSSIWHHENAYVKDQPEAFTEISNDDEVGNLIAIGDAAAKAAKKASHDFVNIAQKAAAEAAREAVKYAMTKDAIAAIPDDDLAHFARAVKGVRMTGYGGILKLIRQRLGIKDNEILSEEEVEKCPKCGGELEYVVMKWSASEGRYMEVFGGDTSDKIVALLNAAKKRAEKGKAKK